MKDASRSLHAAVAGIGIALLLTACADQANPILSPIGGHGGTANGGAGDAAVSEAGALADAEDAYVAPDVQLATCNMLKQDCPKNPITLAPQGCYRISGGAHCGPAGQLQQGSSSCESDLDCAPGLVCARTFDTGGDCQSICDPNNPGYASCPVGYACGAMAKTGELSKFGYCQIQS